MLLFDYVCDTLEESKFIHFTDKFREIYGLTKGVYESKGLIFCCIRFFYIIF